MTEIPKLSSMSHEEKDALILELWEKVRQLEAELASRGKKGIKTSKNSSQPPSKDFKNNLKASLPQKKTPHHQGGRTLTDSPDQLYLAYAETCSYCGHSLENEPAHQENCYDKIDLPDIRPVVTQVKTHGAYCPKCGAYSIASVPSRLAAGSPFGARITSLVTYLRYGHAISYQRLSHMLHDVFGVSLSEGGISRLLQRCKRQLETSVGEIVSRLREAQHVYSDETSARVAGKTQWEWVFQNSELCYHTIAPSRSASVIEEVMAGHQPRVWISDLFSAQSKHPAHQWQVCLAHQLRDCQYAIDQGDTLIAPKLRALFLKALSIHDRRDHLAPSTKEQYRYRLKRELKQCLKLETTHEDGIRLLKRYRKHQQHLLLFLDDESIEPTNNSSEQALRMSVIFRKVTNGFRSEWGRDLFAAVRSVVNTGKRQGLSMFEAIQAALDPAKSIFANG